MRIIFLVFCLIVCVFSQNPSILNVSPGKLSHGSSMTITGSNFGTKSPAAPVMWDNGEHGNSLAVQGWCSYQPSSATTDSFNIAYRTESFRGVSNPHSNGTKFIGGGHEDNRPYAINVGNSVSVTTSLDGTTEDLFVMYYLQWDPLWPTNGYRDAPQFSGNHKFMIFETACTEYSTGSRYTDYKHSNIPQFSSTIQVQGEDTYSFSRSDVLGSWGHFIEISDNSTDQEDRYVLNSTDTYTNSIINSSSESTIPATLDYYTIGGYFCFQDTAYVLAGGSFTGPDGDGEYYIAVAEETQLLNKNKVNTFFSAGTKGSLTATQWDYTGGNVYIGENPSGNTYYATNSACGSLGGASEHGGNANAWRYYDDIYIDNTFSRVMLGNDSTYFSCTIIEPQIPLTWSNSSISAQINLGKLQATQNIYLYVFNSANEFNLSGKLVGSGQQGPSDPPKPRIEAIPDN